MEIVVWYVCAMYAIQIVTIENVPDLGIFENVALILLMDISYN